MRRMLAAFGVCDCHSHVYGPFDKFPLAETRTFTPPESPIESLEVVWSSDGIDRAVLIQGSACGTDHAALLRAIARDPEQRRGVATVDWDVADKDLAYFDRSGVRAVRFNWVKHLLGKTTLSREALMANATGLMERVQLLGWHAEVHVDAQDLELVERLSVPTGMVLVIDHVARLNAANEAARPLLPRLLKLLEREDIWLKISGADRIAAESESVESAAPILRAVIRQAFEKCVWGLDWPHVNLSRKRSEVELIRLLESVVPHEAALRSILIDNPARLYGFPPAGANNSTEKYHQGVIPQ
jgi:2-pyrone-4,6-dicarboxylate lactonase